MKIGANSGRLKKIEQNWGILRKILMNIDENWWKLGEIRESWGKLEKLEKLQKLEKLIKLDEIDENWSKLICESWRKLMKIDENWKSCENWINRRGRTIKWNCIKFRSYCFLLLSFALGLICSKHFRQPLGLQGTLDVKQFRRVRDRPAHADQVCRRSVTPKTNTKRLDERRKRKHPNPLSRNGCKSVFPRCDMCSTEVVQQSNVEVGRHGSADEVHW